MNFWLLHLLDPLDAGGIRTSIEKFSLSDYGQHTTLDWGTNVHIKEVPSSVCGL